MSKCNQRTEQKLCPVTFPTIALAPKEADHTQGLLLARRRPAALCHEEVCKRSRGEQAAVDRRPIVRLSPIPRRADTLYIRLTMKNSQRFVNERRMRRVRSKQPK